ncbi:hypothetical protein ABZ379_12890 [Streptomyces canus]|uniref:hypothetical protein n=1 Tax=Streptomyces canus TaxID=58343 RepID=UPI0033D7C6CA
MMRRGPSSTAAVATVAACLFAVLTACSSDSSDGSAAEGKGRPGGSGPTSDPAHTPTRSSTPSPSGPCADGTCEIKVAVGDVVNVPAAYGLGPIKVTAIGDGKVDMVAGLTGSGYSVSGCSGGGSVSSAGGGGVGLNCEEGPAATINDAMSLKVVDVLDAAAVLRIEPAR